MTFYQDSNSRLLVKMLADMEQSHHLFERDTTTSQSSQSSQQAKISPAILFIIIILAVIFFISGLLHLLVRFFIKQRSSTSSSYSHSNRYQENVSTTDPYQRQLQQLFHLHDSGLDQAFIDALPVFQYKEIVGLKEPFDCAVCLCEFTEQDKLRLLPICSHAFHIDCIDTWLLSNSTCPLCRGALYGHGLGVDNPVFEFDDLRDCDDDGVGVDYKPFEIEIVNEKKVFPVRLGKFRSVSNEGKSVIVCEEKVEDVGETSSSNLDARRCFSMGSYQYIEADSTLQVALCPKRPPPNGNGGELKINKVTEGYNGHFTSDIGDAEARKISVGNKKESLSVSKIWLWSKKGKFQDSSNVDLNGLPPIDMNLPWTRNHVT